MTRVLAFGVTLVAVGALLGWAVFGQGGGSRKPDPGTHISPARYQEQLQEWCRPQDARGLKLVRAVDRAVAKRDRRAVLAAIIGYGRWNLAFDEHLESTPVPAAMKARMAPVLELMATADPTIRTVLAGLRTNNGGDVYVGADALGKIFKRVTKDLRSAGLRACS